MRHLLTLDDVTSEEIQRIFALTKDIKSKFQEGIREPILPGRVMALLFEKPSLRTRVSFQAGMAHMGGTSMMLGDDVGFGKRERADDFSRVISEFIDVLVFRSKKHELVEEVAKHATCSVINGLTDLSHPCQALADLYTIKEHLGSFDGAKLAWVGDANNVARSLAIACSKVEIPFSIAAPKGYEFEESQVAAWRDSAPGWEMITTNDPHEAVADASAIYTDVWASMGQEAEQAKRIEDFAAYQVNDQLMASAPEGAYFMHCLPAKRGQEVTDSVLDSPNSIVVPQAGNRMHVQKGILAWILGAQS